MDVNTVIIRNFDGTVEQQVTTFDYSEEVEHGANWLDKNVGPDWVDQINLPTLDLGDTRACILGQVFMRQVTEAAYPYVQTGFDYGLQAHSELAYTDGHDGTALHGFDIGWTDRAEQQRIDHGVSTGLAYEWLSDSWIAAITKRRATRAMLAAEALATESAYVRDGGQRA